MILSAPLHVHWEVTNECNYRCKHCYQQNDEKRVTLPTQELMFIAEQIVSSGVFQVSISGGEPFFVNDIIEILDYLSLNNVKIVICSNGSQIHSDALKKLQQLSVPVQVSLDSHIARNIMIFAAQTMLLKMQLIR